ncbi:hypothetical protein CLAIMM_03949 isoform 3 [Cladophialophora immunda]|nr:hypothetical protein CLAIMM_03949 isoform 3 [Cladophialophora immunda]
MDPNYSHVQHSTQRHQFKFYNVLMLVAMGFGSMSFGYSSAVIAITLGQPTFLKYFGLDTNPNANALIATTNGLYQTGGFLATFSVSVLADRWGRKWAIAVAAILILVSGALLAGSVHIAMFIVFRFFSGAGGFMILAAVPLLMNEVVPAKNRGMLVDIHGACFLFGYMIANWIGYGFYFLSLTSNSAWRAPLAFQCLPPLTVLCFLPFLPESPRWLLMNDRYEDAGKVLLKLHTAEEAAVELVEIRNQMQIDKTLDSSYWNILRKPSYRKRAILSVATTCSVNFSGILVINNYGPSIYKSLGYGTEKQLLLTCGWNTLCFGAGVMAIFFIDYFSRPKLLVTGMLSCMSCLIVLAALIATFGGSENTAALKAAVAMIFIYAVTYESLLDGTQFVYIGELFPSHLRSKGVSLGVAGIALINIVFLQAAPTAFANIGWRYYLVFIIPSGILAVVIFFVFPDTKDVPLEEISAMFGVSFRSTQGPAGFSTG